MHSKQTFNQIPKIPDNIGVHKAVKPSLDPYSQAEAAGLPHVVVTDQLLFVVLKEL